MNERFKELIVQAIKEVGPDDQDRNAKEATLQKFAELIVLECIGKAEDYGLGVDAVAQMKEDFGVEE